MDYRQLLASPDVQLRIYCLNQLETRLGDMDEGEIKTYLAQALSDSDPGVQELARRLERIHTERIFGKGQGGESFALFDDPRHLKEPAANLLKGFDVEQLRAAAHDILFPVITRLHDVAMGKREGPVEKIVDALGSIRHPGSLAVLESLAQSSRKMECLAGALSRYTEPRAESILLQMAGDVDNPNRPEATLTLGSVRNLDPFTTLEAAIEDSSPEVRKSAATALGDIATDETCELLCSLLEDPVEDVVLSSLAALARMRNPTSVSAIVQKVVATDSSRIRASAAIALARLESLPSQDTLVKLLADADERVRANAVEALGQYNLPYELSMRIFPPLLKDENHRVRGNAALAFYPVNQQMAVDTVKKMFDSSNSQMRAAAAYCASQIQTSDTATWLTTLVLTELDTAVLSSALRALERFNRKEVRDIFVKVTKHNKPEIRTLAVQLLGEIGKPAQVGFFTQMFKSEKEPNTRSALVSAMAKLAGPETLNFLPQYLSDPDERVVANAIDGLNRTGNIEVIAYLKPLLKHPNNRIRANTILALWNLGDTKSLAQLQEMLDSSDQGFVDSGLYVMSSIGKSLRLSELEAHPMLPISLSDYYKRVVERGDGLRTAPLPDAGGLETGIAEEQTTERLVLDDLEDLAEPAAGPEPTGSAEFLDVIEKADMTPAVGTITQRVNEEEELERILMLTLDSDDEAEEALDMFTTLYARNPYAAYLKLNRLARAKEDLPEEVAETFERGEDDFVSSLFVLARTFRRKGEVERSLGTYLKIFHKQLSLLTDMVEFGIRELDRDNPTPASTVMKTISSILGLKPDIHALLGDFYLSEKAFDESYQQFYMAHVADPGDISVSLKLAFLCGKTKRKGLGRVICQNIMNREDSGEENHQKAAKILERLSV